MGFTTGIAERGLVPEILMRMGIRSRLRIVLKDISFYREKFSDPSGQFLLEFERRPLAVHTECANKQHYGLPVSFFGSFLGRRMKYSCCLWEKGVASLDEAEECMLEMTCRRAGIEKGHAILDLGCGWGSLSLYMAEKYPDSKILAVSNSLRQVEYISFMARERGYGNLVSKCEDVSEFEPCQKFDRILSIEMFEHMRNWKLLFKKISTWLRGDGRLFCHFFCHRDTPYIFRSGNEKDWMGYYFFSGGMMPSFTLPFMLDEDLQVVESWKVNGLHYTNTLEAWLKRFDHGRDSILPILEDHYGQREALLWLRRWRLFILACSELFSYNRGEEWFVAHFLMKPEGKR